MENVDLTELVKKEHDGKWIALSRNYKNIVDFGRDLTELKKRIDDSHTEVVYMKLPKFGKRYAFTQV
jgi:hypothetical protein